MERLSFDTTVCKTFEGCKINYGIKDGNDKIVFIKSGAGGNCRGSKNKYLKIAHRLHQKHGFTVICGSNPLDCSEHPHIDEAVISSYAQSKGFADYTLYLMGSSDGGYQVVQLAKQNPNVQKLLGINASFKQAEDFARLLAEIPSVEKILVYGAKDDDYHITEYLKNANIENLKIITVDGADHEFNGMLDEYIALSDLL